MMKTNTNNRHQKTETFSKKKSRRASDPAEDDHLQQIPQRLREIIKSKERMNMSVQKRREAAKPKLLAGRGDIPVPHFRRGKSESERAYVCRMTEESEHVLFLTNTQLERKPEMMRTEEQQQTEQKTSKKKKKWLGRTKLQQQKQKVRRQEEREEEQMFTDEVQFGEVAMAPPSLSVKPKKARDKPQGASKGLLLSSLMGHSPAARSNPSMARRRMMEEERERVVKLYRQMKKQQEGRSQST